MKCDETKKKKGYICNPATGRWVKEDGPVGKKLKDTKSKSIKKIKNVKSTKKEKSSVINYKNRPCNVNKSKLYPDAYTKQELVNMAKKAGLEKISALSKDDLCKQLNKLKMPTKKSIKKVQVQKIKPIKPKVGSPRGSPPKVGSPRGPPPKVGSPRGPPPKVGDCISRSKIPLREYQKKLVQHLRKYRGAIAAFPTGSGKTLAAVTASQCILDEHPDWKVIVVTPVSLQENFKKEMKAYGVKNTKRYEFYTLTMFSNMIQNDKIKCNSKTFLIIDEAHNLRTKITENAGIRARNAVLCAMTAGKVLLLTATPLYNAPSDIINLVAMVTGKKPLTHRHFEKVLADNSLFERYVNCLFVFYKKTPDDLKNYPSTKEHNIFLEMSESYYKKYREVEEQKLKSIDVAKDPWRLLVGVRQATLNLEESAKIKWVVDKIKEGNKTVVFSQFVTSGLKTVQNSIKKSKIRYVEVTGNMKMEERNAAVRDYNSGKVDVLFISKAGGEGLDLKGTRNIILMEAGWNRPGEEQVMGRAIRLGSHAHLPKEQQHVDVYHLYLKKKEPLKHKGEKQSADILVKEMNEKKIKTNTEFIKRIEKVGCKNLPEFSPSTVKKSPKKKSTKRGRPKTTLSPSISLTSRSSSSRQSSRSLSPITEESSESEFSENESEFSESESDFSESLENTDSD